MQLSRVPVAKCLADQFNRLSSALMSTGATCGVYGFGKTAQRQQEAPAKGLNVGFLARPHCKKRGVTPAFRDAEQLLNLRLRKKQFIILA